MTYRQIIRPAAVLVTTGLFVLGGAGLAAADVSVTAENATPGSTTVLNFAVSDLRSDSPTTKVEIKLPSGQPFGTVAARPKIGWDTSLVRPAGATAGPISSVVWTLTDDRFGIAPGAFDVFSLQVGPLPTTGPLVFPTLQTYGNQLVDSWAPTVAEPAPAIAQPTPPTPQPAAEKPKPDNRGRVVVGLAVGLVLIVLAVLGAGLGKRRPTEEELVVPQASTEATRVEV